jgi:hypothetical protein
VDGIGAVLEGVPHELATHVLALVQDYLAEESVVDSIVELVKGGATDPGDTLQSMRRGFYLRGVDIEEAAGSAGFEFTSFLDPFLESFAKLLKAEAGRPDSPLANRVMVEQLDVLITTVRDVATDLETLKAGIEDLSLRTRSGDPQATIVEMPIPAAYERRLSELEADGAEGARVMRSVLSQPGVDPGLVFQPTKTAVPWFIEVCRAVNAIDLPGMIAATEDLPPWDGPERVIALSLRAHAMLVKGRIDDGLSITAAILEEDSERTSVAILHSKLLLAAASGQSGDEQQQTIKAAETVARGARDLRRKWRGPSEDAVEVLCDAALLRGDLEEILKVGLGEPIGSALPREADYEPVRQSALLAARGLGREDLARSLLSETDDAFSRVILEGGAASSSGASEETWRAAFEAADSGMRSFEAQYNLALLGVEDIPGVDELRSGDPMRADVLEATSLAKRGSYEEAVQLLRPHVKSSPRAAWALSRLHFDRGQVGRGLRVLRDLVSDFNDSAARLELAQRLAEDGQWEEVEREGLLLLATPGVEDATVIGALELLVEGAAQRLDWPQAESHARALVDQSGDRVDTRWVLVATLWNQRFFQKAWEQLLKAPPLEPVDEEQALMYVILRSRFESTSEVIESLVGIANQYWENEELCATALLGVVLITSRNQDADFEETAIGSWQEAVGRFVEQRPESAYLSSISGTVEENLEHIRQSLLPGIRQQEALKRSVQLGLQPYGALAATSGRPYGLALIGRAAGCHPICVPESLGAERAACRDGFDEDIVIEPSVLNTMSLIPEAWTRLIARFDRIRIPLLCVDDLIATEDSLAMPSTGTMTVDPLSEQLRFSEISDELRETAQARAAWIIGKARNLSVEQTVAWDMFDEPPDGDDHRFSWLLPLELARRDGLPLMTDDPVVRAAARQAGVSTFGSVAFLLEISEADADSEASVKNHMGLLKRSGFVDLPQEDGEIQALAREEGFAPGIASFAMTRPIFWRDLQSALGLFEEIVDEVVQVDRTWLSVWVAHAAIGMGTTGGLVGVAGLISACARKFDVSADEFKSLIFAGRSAAIQLGVNDEELLPIVLRLIVGELHIEGSSASPDEMNVRVLCSALDPLDQLVLHRILEQSRVP